jgi:hypothetical protein
MVVSACHARRVTAALAACGALAAPSAAAGAPDITAGAGTYVGPEGRKLSVTVAAASENGAQPRGSFVVDAEIPSIGFQVRERATVTCHRVTDNLALMYGRLANPVDLEGVQYPAMLLVINDEGTPGAGRDDVAFGLAPDLPGGCTGGDEPFDFESDITRGDFQVLDR